MICRFAIKLIRCNEKITSSKWYRKCRNIIKDKVLIHKDKIRKYEMIGLFVIVVFPGTGMWTASMLAGFLNMNTVKATFLIVLAGTLVGLVYFFGASGVFEMIKVIF